MKNEYEFGKTLSAIMQEKSIRQIELSQLTGFSKGYISELVKSKKSPELNTLKVICDALNISLIYFLLRSYKTDGKEGEKHQLIEKIAPTLIEIDELIYPDNSSKSKRPIKPIITASLEIKAAVR